MREIPIQELEPTPVYTVYTDNHLPAKYGAAYRQAVLQAKGDTTTVVLPWMVGPQHVTPMFQMLEVIKKKGALGGALSKEHSGYAAFRALVDAGLLDKTGGAQPGLQGRLRANPRIEMIYQVTKGHYAVIVFRKEGMDYVDPKGTACSNDQVLVPAQNGQPAQKPPFSALLRELWGGFYGIRAAIKEEGKVKGESQAEQDKRISRSFQQRAQKDCKLHTGVTQQDDDYSSLDWCLTNLKTLGENIAATPEDLKNAKIIKRESIVKTLRGKTDPKNPSNKFNLEYKNESKDKQKWQEWVERYRGIYKQAKDTYARAETENAHVEATPGAELPVWAKVSIENPPIYIDPNDLQTKIKKLNEYPTDSDGVTSSIKIKDGEITAYSTGGSDATTFHKRFTLLARELSAAVGTGRPIVVIKNTIYPPEESATCVKAFEAYFGAENVRFEEADAVEDTSAEFTMGATPMRN